MNAPFPMCRASGCAVIDSGGMPRRLYTQEEIDALISCAKVFDEAPRLEMRLDRGHFRNEMRLRSSDGNSQFRCFMRQSEDLPENFSIGWVFTPRDGTGDITLLRCNGPHGGYNYNCDPDHPHWGYHVHRASASMIEADLRPEREATQNKEFASFVEARQYFWKAANIDTAGTCFAQEFLPFSGSEQPSK
jgi:hypothetical protein